MLRSTCAYQSQNCPALEPLATVPSNIRAYLELPTALHLHQSSCLHCTRVFPLIAEQPAKKLNHPMPVSLATMPSGNMAGQTFTSFYLLGLSSSLH